MVICNKQFFPKLFNKKFGGKVNTEILFLQTFGILLVVLGHSGEDIPYLSKWIYSFHMPLFMFISGYLLSLTNNQKINQIEMKTFIIKKVKRLLIPYFVISSLAYLPKYILGKFAVRPVELNLETYLKGFLYPWDNPIIFFWFLPTLFIIMLSTIILMKIYNKKIWLLLFFSFFISLLSNKYIKIEFLNVSGVLNYLFFFILGVYYNINEKYFQKILESNITIIVTMAILIINCGSNYFSSIDITHKMISVIGIVFSICLSKKYNKNKMKFLNHLNGKSYSIYLLSWFPQVFVRILGFQILKLTWIVVLPISFFMGTYIPYFINLIGKKIIEKNSKFRFLKVLLGI